MNPNRVYLLVVTFYEVRHEGRSDAVRFAYAKRGWRVLSMERAEYTYRRRMCGGWYAGSW